MTSANGKLTCTLPGLSSVQKETGNVGATPVQKQVAAFAAASAHPQPGPRRNQRLLPPLGVQANCSC